MKKLLLLILGAFILLSIHIAHAQTCEVTQVKDTLQKSLIDYLPDPATSKLNPTQIRDLLDFYSDSSNKTNVICGIQATRTALPYDTIIKTFNNLSRIQAIPFCSDGTHYGQCSLTKPKYCFAGQLYDRCSLCGCQEGYQCLKDTTGLFYLKYGWEWGKCVKTAGDIDGDGIPDPLINKGVVGFGGNSSASNIVALLTREDEAREDLNKDGDMSDTVLRYYDINTGTVTNTGITTGNWWWTSLVIISNNIIVFSTSESPLNKDLNGDGDMDDLILRYYDINRNNLVDLGFTIGWSEWAGISNNILAISPGRILQYYDINTDKLVDTGISVERGGVSISNNIISFTKSGTLMYYDLDTGTLVNTTIAADWGGTEVYNNIIVFSTSESSLNKDLNGDGDTYDRILRYYDLNTGKVVSTGITLYWNAYTKLAHNDHSILHSVYEYANGQDLNGDGDTYDNILRYYDINTGVITNTTIDASGGVGLSDNTIFLFTRESSVNEDLNRDGDTTDTVLRYITLSKYKAEKPKDIHCTFTGCSERKPNYCSDGKLTANCQACGCGEGRVCTSNGTCIIPTCSDRTFYGKCSATLPGYCDNGDLIERCDLCGCSGDASCQPDNSCKRILGSAKTLTFGSAGNQTLYLKIPKNITLINAAINLDSSADYSTLNIGGDEDEEWSLGVYDIHQKEWGSGYCSTFARWNGLFYTIDTYPLSGKWENDPIEELDIRINPGTEVTFDTLRFDINHPYHSVNARLTAKACRIPEQNVAALCISEPITLFTNYSMYNLNPGLYEIPLDAPVTLSPGIWKLMFQNYYPDPSSLPYDDGIAFRICGFNQNGNRFLIKTATTTVSHEASPQGIQLRNKERREDIKAEIKSHLDMCVMNRDGNCLIPLIFSATSAGSIPISNVNLSYCMGFCKLCSDDTISGECSKAKPYYCNEGILINSCSECGCPSDSVCQHNGSCTLPLCSNLGGHACANEEYCPGNKLNATDADKCCSEQCVKPQWSLCSECGKGIFNTCDRAECNSINQTCYFLNNLASGTCTACTGAKCKDYGANNVSCIENHCNLGNCVWNGTMCVTCTDEDGDGYRSTIECGGAAKLDCNDADSNVHPGAQEICDNGIDEDCDGFSCISQFFCQPNGTCTPCQIVKKIPNPNPSRTPGAIVQAGQFLYHTDLFNVYKLDPENGNILSARNTLQYSHALAYDGNTIYYYKYPNGPIYKLDPVSLETGSSIPFSKSWAHDMAFSDNGQYLWVAICSITASLNVYKVDKNNGQILGSFKSPQGCVNGIFSDGRYLWISESETNIQPNRIYKIDPDMALATNDKNKFVIGEYFWPFVGDLDLTNDGFVWATDGTNINELFKIKCDMITPLKNRGCSDGTVHENCSMTKPLYCNNGLLINNCTSCGCPSNQTCLSNGSCITATCSNLGGDICINGEYCPGSQLNATDSDKCCSKQCATPQWASCSECGKGLFNICDRTECSTINQTCYFLKNTIGGSCTACTGASCESYRKDNSTCRDDPCKLGRCLLANNSCVTCTDKDGDRYNSTASCGGAAKLDCNDNNPSIYPGAKEICGNGIDEDCDGKDLICMCGDGTVYGNCSLSKPLFCNNGTLIRNCSPCGCLAGQQCLANGSCITPKCTDNTLYNNCSTTKPLYCSNGTLINRCSTCGCVSGYQCKTDGVCSVPLPTNLTCSDGTINDKCSAIKPKYCSNGTLVNNCQVCKCVNSRNITLVNQAPAEAAIFNGNKVLFSNLNSSGPYFFVGVLTSGSGVSVLAPIGKTTVVPGYGINITTLSIISPSATILLETASSFGCNTNKSCSYVYNSCQINSDCGIDGFIGTTTYCVNNQLYQDYNNYTCKNPATIDSICMVLTKRAIKNPSCMSPLPCTDGTLSSACSTTKPRYCLNGTLVNSCSTCGCPNGQTCQADGSCATTQAIACYNSSSCGTQTLIGNYFCSNGNLYGNYTNYTCLNPGTTNSLCQTQMILKLVDSCQLNEQCITGTSECQPLQTNQTICRNAQTYQLCDTLDITFSDGYKQLCCQEHGLCCS